jgi:hypothetical protein
MPGPKSSAPRHQVSEMTARSTLDVKKRADTQTSIRLAQPGAHPEPHRLTRPRGGPRDCRSSGVTRRRRPMREDEHVGLAKMARCRVVTGLPVQSGQGAKDNPPV